MSSGERVIVGVNKHIRADEEALEILRISGDVEEGQRNELMRLRGERDAAVVAARLDALEAGAAAEVNLMPLLIEAARARATLGEIVNAMKRVFGGYREPPRV